jgi:CRP-like cAMP-binding protein
LRKLDWFIEVITLTDGNSFGELALINDKPRLATVRCKSLCTFAIFSKQQYRKVFETLAKKEYDTKIKFFE